jgi:hypothetical protein
MKKLRHVFLALAVFAIAIPQQAQYVGARVSYAKVKPGQWNNFLKLEKDIKDYHQARVEKGIITDWEFYEKIFSGTNEPHDFIWVHINDDFKKTENPNPRDLAESLYSKEEIDDFQKRIGETREVIGSEYYDRVMTAEGGTQANYLRVNFYQVKGSDRADYLALREEYIKPIFEHMIKEGHLTSWSMWHKTPYGPDYQYVTVDGFSEYGQWKEGMPLRAAFDKLFPEDDFSAAGEKLMGTRTLVKSEIWKLVEHTEPAGGE